MSFWEGFEKQAAPRWLKEIHRVVNSLPSHGSRFGEKIIKGLKNKAGDKNRKQLAEALGINKIKHPVDKLPMSHPYRRGMYFKHRKKVHKILPNDDVYNSYKQNPKGVLKSLEEIKRRNKKYLRTGKDGKMISRFKEVNPKGTETVSHVAFTPEALRKGESVRSITAPQHGYSINNIFAFKSKHKKEINTFAPKKIRKEYGVEVMESKVPKRDIIHSPNTISTDKAELVVPGDKFLKGLKKQSSPFWLSFYGK